MACRGTGVELQPDEAFAGPATDATDAALREDGKIAARAGEPRTPPYSGGAALGLWLAGYDEGARRPEDEEDYAEGLAYFKKKLEKACAQPIQEPQRLAPRCHICGHRCGGHEEYCSVSNILAKSDCPCLPTD